MSGEMPNGELIARVRRRWPVRPETEVEHYARCAHIRDVVAAAYGIAPEAILSDQRNFSIAHPRQVAMYLCTELTKYSLPRIGSAFRRDHTTVMYAVNAVKDRMLAVPSFKEEVDQIRKRLTDPQITSAEDVVAEVIDRQAADMEALARRAFAIDPERTVAAVLAALRSIAGGE